ncbi:hypothetical protein AYI69_g3305 [Smittium culicis]|uniref:Uncharacterized protein n=1 Tax=Smittium culicis TaxID=133412 RepID=A0A1R1YK24_9FUNG|nr:hypothetical protein AYI69_g3305 [Smittium culicis]
MFFEDPLNKYFLVVVSLEDLYSVMLCEFRHTAMSCYLFQNSKWDAQEFWPYNVYLKSNNDTQLRIR